MFTSLATFGYESFLPLGKPMPGTMSECPGRTNTRKEHRKHENFEMFKMRTSSRFQVNLGIPGNPWGPMGTPGYSWGPMETHVDPWEPMGTHGDPWEPMGIHGNPWEPIETHGEPMGTH